MHDLEKTPAMMTCATATYDADEVDALIAKLTRNGGNLVSAEVEEENERLAKELEDCQYTIIHVQKRMEKELEKANKKIESYLADEIDRMESAQENSID